MTAELESPSSNPDYGFMMFDGRYVSTIWVVHGPGEDWLAFLWKDRDSQWRLTHRFKYYGKENKVFGGDDEVSWTDLAFSRNSTEASVIRTADAAADKCAKEYGGVPVHKIMVRTSSVETYERIMRREEFMHFKEDE